MTMQSTMRATGAPLNRLDGVQKVTGAATYAYEYPVEVVAYVFPVQSTIAKGRVSSIDASAARALPGVIAVLSHENAPQLAPVDDAELAVFQSDTVAYRGQLVAAVVAETSEIARQAASLVAVRYQEQPHDVELRADRADLYKPEIVGPFYPPDTASGDVEAALTQAPVSLDHTYTTPAEHNNHPGCCGHGIQTPTRARARDRPLRWRRVRLQGVPAPARDPRRDGRANDQAARQARPHPAADVRAGGLSRADHPAHAAGR